MNAGAQNPESLRNALKYRPEATRRKRLQGMKTARQRLHGLRWSG